MADLQSELALADGTTFLVKFKAINVDGDSSLSAVNTDVVKAQSKPTTQPSNLAASAFTKDTITLSWTDISSDADIGFSAITNYKIYMTTGTTYTLQSTIAAGAQAASITTLVASTTYKFKITAINIHGESSQSSEFTQTTSNVPDTPDAVVLTQVGTDLKLTWQAPFNNGKSISGYTVEFKSSGGFISSTLLCDPAGNATQLSTKTCEGITMANLVTALSLTAGDDIQIRIKAENSEGFSFYSTENTDSIVLQTIPAINPLSIFASSITKSSVILTWTAVAGDSNTGYSPIVNYEIF